MYTPTFAFANVGVFNFLLITYNEQISKQLFT